MFNKKFIIAFAFAIMFFCSAVTVNAMTETERQALIAQIRAQIAVLMQQIAQLQAQENQDQEQVQNQDTSWCHTFTAGLGYSNSGIGEVANLHMALQKEGISFAPDIGNIYSHGTSDAVVKFQTKYEISQTGYVGMLTRAKLNQLYACASGNPEATETPENPVVANPTPPACTPNWQCGVWSACSGGSQTRNCSDANTCGIETDKPITMQTCAITTDDCAPNWQCGIWNQCFNGIRMRTCENINKNPCAFSLDNPPLRENCTICAPSYNCGAWGTCLSDGTPSHAMQYRSCADTNNCGFVRAQPDPMTQQSCTCVPDWQCSDWGSCEYSKQTRTCTKDRHGCGIPADESVTKRSCDPILPPIWKCGEWSTCRVDQQVRTCLNQNCLSEAKDCWTLKDRPEQVRTCICIPNWSCDAWGSCNEPGQNEGFQSRKCTDLNNCKFGANSTVTIDQMFAMWYSPERSSYRSCDSSCKPNWLCPNNWLPCVDGKQLRYLCTDGNYCGATIDRSLIQRSCN